MSAGNEMESLSHLYVLGNLFFLCFLSDCDHGMRREES